MAEYSMDTKCQCVGHPYKCWLAAAGICREKDHPHDCPCVKEPAKERRERIATAALVGAMAGVYAGGILPKDLKPAEVPGAFAELAILTADALIAELDKE